VEGTARWLRSLEVVPTINALRSHAESIAKGELEKTLGRLNHLSEADRKAVEGLASAIINKLLHSPFTSLRREAQEDNGADILEAARRLFDLRPEAPPAPKSEPEPETAPEPTPGRAPGRRG
jgi:glutamyl-tRNA reductase